MGIGTIHNQVKMQLLDAKWQKKKQDINKKQNSDMTKEQIMLENLKRQAETERERSDCNSLYTKLKTGGTLTDEEIAYLKEHDPEALAEYERARMEKKAYENALKNCRTKEDVERLKLNRMGNFAAKAKAIANNPYIPKAKKLELMNRLNNEVCCIRDAHEKFVKSRAYKDLPTEADIADEKRQVEDEQQEKTEEKPSKDNNDTEDIAVLNEDTDIENDIKYNKKSHNLVDIKLNDEVSANYDDMSMTFEGLSESIENYVVKNSEKKSGFVVSV